ncbi:MAG: potassium channel family protein [Bacteroidetes bacterium]|nr:potassium channel family protein [Bacteroidota bacterium]MBU1579715.1 potassium channel family protein [Bacteroidota bacterium]MBU2558099.1 potassium channel family protein [Bacteroidota bacterium]
MKNKEKHKGTWIQKHRFKLLLLASLMVLLLPAFAGESFLAELLFFVSMTFLFIQSMIAATSLKAGNILLRYAAVVLAILVIWMEPAGYNYPYYSSMKLLFLVLFFGFIIFSLLRFIGKSNKINTNVILVVINIYLLMGIVAGNIANLLYISYPNAYHFPESMIDPNFVDFLYFSFITMATVGYGDISPAISETKTFAYLTAIAGQLYVAIVVAIIVGKYLVKDSEKKYEQEV